MNGVVTGAADGSVEVGFGQRPLWGVALFGLLCIQAATTASLFDPGRRWSALCDDRPVISGRHSLHLYHGQLGAESWRDGRFGSCYDPAFQAGYPKTPVFDSGSRPAELFLIFGREPAASYKMGLAGCCLLVPLLFAAVGRLLGLGPGVACGSALAAQLCWWAGPVQRLLHHGDLDWLLGGLIVVLHAALLVRYHRAGGLCIWFGMLLTAALGWFFQPILWAGFVLIFLPFYVVVTMRHGGAWHLGAWLAWGGGLLANLGWLVDWIRYCWIQMPIVASNGESWNPSSWQRWMTDLGANHAESRLAAVLLAGGLIGLLGMLIRGRTSAALAFGSTALLLPALSLGTGYWRPLEIIGPAKLFVLACAFAAAPCAAAVADLFQLLTRLTRRPALAAFLVLLALGGAAWFVRDDFRALLRPATTARPLAVGLTVEQQALVKSLQDSTSPKSRILWEDRSGSANWTPLLPLLTQRNYLGGLDPEAGVEHMFARLTSTTLAGRPLAEWSDSELDDFCHRYNVGYIACWTPALVQRFRSWSRTELVMPLSDGGEGWLLAVKRAPAFVLKGKAKILQWDARRIALADVEPEDGVIVLSLHHQEGFRIAPSDIRVERQPDPYDPIPFLRLRMSGPVLRLTLTWE
jgi:hypothetical protein